jgi:cellulose synthase/poly-beta-1,6-N-acetylglucosamine synthase-like glycosyltransferase
MIILTVAVAAAAAVLMLPTISDVVSLVRPARPRRGMTNQSNVPRLLFLVPAHDEELLIGSCVRSLLGMHYPANRIDVCVIADNCTDATAERARAAGARCLERHDLQHPGKPRAIAWALTQVRVDEHDAVVIVDADTTVDPGFAAALAEAGPVSGKALQAYFDVANSGDSSLTRMAAVLAAANYRAAYPLKRRVGVNAPLLGNGMCIGSDVLATHGWHAFTIAEDWELYALYTAQGVPIESVEGARLFAQEASSLGQSSTQRQRWTAGKLTVVGRHLGELLRSRRIGFWQKLDATAELSAPGPVVQLALTMSLIAAIRMVDVPGAAWLTLALVIPLGRLAVYAAIGLAIQPDPLRAARAFMFLPVYAAWRLGTVIASLKMIGDTPWVRTARN